MEVELGKLSVLDTFGARGNFIAVIPNEFCKLTFLRWLTLEDNLIEELPRNFKGLTSLKHLNLENNCIKDLRYCFLGKNKIKEVSVKFLNEVRHIVKLDLRATELLGASSEVIHEEEWEDVSVASDDEEWVAEEEDTDDDDLDWEESLPSSELDLSELSDIEDFEADDVDRAMALPEIIANIIPRISYYILNGI
ncbi:hypothetical protein J437_LFUL007614 [Ladona fulva]|uniref:Uncharacterized protein n=1 Tax=Ladona fulva TaxID=123851 RepID=A0A8K0P0U6_LADFU|nr:hypothetical protein J437_LFUL007614 [Ladona fulva]